MNLTGQMLIGNAWIKGEGIGFQGMSPAKAEPLPPIFHSSTASNVNRACELASTAYDSYRALPLEQRALFLEAIADEILALGDALVTRTMAETGLPQARVEGERGRTMGQLRLFASVVRDGGWVDARIDPALPARAPLPRSDLRQRHIALGPVAVFGASNFPLAFSVAGGDTASALAAGCPVVVKAHAAHPGTSELIAGAIQRAGVKCDMPEGVFSLLLDSGHEVGALLVANPAIKAVGFTGSRSGGTALMRIAADRPEPIPVYAEMSSINPVFLLPHALRENGKALAAGFVGSLTMGAGQLCTNPGLVIGMSGSDFDTFIGDVGDALAESDPQTMLTEDIHGAYVQGTAQLDANAAVTAVANGADSAQPNRCQPRVFATTGSDFLADEQLQNEVFGAASVMVHCESADELIAVAEALEGQLTATMQLVESDAALARQLLPVLERKAGRVLCNGYPTGVEVCHAMVHGGPFPATSDSRTTSVGSAAIARFLRPVCYQDMPSWLLPEELKDENSLGIRRLVDGAPGELSE